jgi:hypothetical protein
MNGGNVFVANTVNMTVSDPIIELGSNNIGTNDLGIIMSRPAANSNVAVVFDESDDILRMGYTLNGASDSIVDLDSNALAVSVQGALSAGSNLEVGTANLFVDTSTSRVGIGMSNPSYTLDVDGDINLSTGSTLKINGTDAVFSNWTANGSDIYRSSGNVGIGTNNPTHQLHIGPKDNDHIYLASANNRYGWILDTEDQTGGVVPFRIIKRRDNVDTTTVTIDNASGYVGIGTSNSPTELLHVFARSSSESAFIRIQSGSGGTNPATESGIKLTESGQYGFQFVHSAATDLLKVKHQDSNGSVNQDDIMVWHPNGSVGIGTATPRNKLDVRSDNYATFGKATYNAAGWSGIRLGTPYATNHDAYCSVIESYNNHASDYNSDLRFKTSNGNNASGNERMRITSAGNVGIGTASPMNTGLHIANSYLASGGNTTHLDPQIFITGDSGTGGNQVSAIGFSGNSAGDTHQRMVAGSVYYKGGGGNYGMDGYLGIAVANSSTSGTDPYGLTEGELESHTRIAIKNNGNVGIGTTDPKSALHVTGSVSYNNQNTPGVEMGVHVSTYAAIEMTASAGYQSWIDFKTTNTDSDYADRILAGTGHMSLFTSNAERMRIDSSGRVAIGTTSPNGDSKLDVRGYALSDNPAFYAWDNVSSYVLSSSDDYTVHFDSTTYNIGSHYNTSNNRFTCPVAGTYIFAAVIAHDSAGGLNGSVYFSFYVNGVNKRDICEGLGAHAAHMEQHAVFIIELGKNDYVDVRSRSNSAINFTNGNHGAYYRNCFQGALLG